jgi:transcriptional regulator with XRE-family HTH domain
MYLASNLKFLRKRKGKTQVDVAHELGIKRPTYSGYENGVSQPDTEALITLSKYFHIAIDTLLKVDLTSLSERQICDLERGNDVYLTGSQIRVLATTVDSSNEENIELVPEKAKAGYATGFADPEYIKELPQFQLPFLSKQKKYRTFQLSGDSMLPIPSGSWVTGEFVQDWRNIVSGHAYLILTLEEGIVFKIVENLIETEGILRLYSLNPIYKPYDVHVSQIKEIWQFVHYISSELPDPLPPKDDVRLMLESIKRDIELLKTQLIDLPKKQYNLRG